MIEATDNAAESLEGVSYQDSDAVIKEFIAKIDKASELASAKICALAHQYSRHYCYRKNNYFEVRYIL